MNQLSQNQNDPKSKVKTVDLGDDAIPWSNTNSSQAQRMLKQSHQLDYQMSYKCGYLAKLSQKALRKAWADKFFLLSNIGLVYMDRPGSKDCKLLPLFDFSINDKDKTNNLFEIKTGKGSSYDMQLKAPSRAEYDDWMAAF